MTFDSLYNDTIINSTDDDDDDDDDFNEEFIISPTIRFWILLIPSIASVICSIIVLYIILSKKQHRHSLNYRVIIIQLIGGLIFLLARLPIYLSYLHFGYVWPQTPMMCQFSWFVGDGYADTMTILMAWASFERHILIFHEQTITTRKKRFFVHYLPVTLIICYCLLYYLVVMAFPPCENVYNYDEIWCSSSCLYKNKILIMFDTLYNDILATLLVAFFSLSLIIRVIWHHHVRFGRQARWRKHRKIIVILLSISLIYLLFNLPMMILELAAFFGLSENTVDQLEPYFEFLNYFIFIIYPFICLSTTTFAKICNRRQRRVIAPVVLTVVGSRPKCQRPFVQE